MSQTFSNVRGPSGDVLVSGGDCFGFDVGDISGFTYLSSDVIAILDISFWSDSLMYPELWCLLEFVSLCQGGVFI
jgi:hypothetical protein